MYRLYYSPGAASFVVHWLLIELGVEHELQRLDLQAGEQKQPAYLALNPAGVVPTLVTEAGPLAETAAILLWLADRHPDAGLAPAVDSLQRSSYLQAIVRLTNTLQPAYRRWFYPHELAGPENAERIKAGAREDIEREFASFDRQLARSGDYLLGDQLSAADFYLVMLMRWSRNMPNPADRLPALAALAARLKARPSFATLYAREGLTEWA